MGHAADNLRVGRDFRPSAHELLDGGIPFVAILEPRLLDQSGPAAERGVDAKNPNGLVRPLARQAALAPGADVFLRAAGGGGGPLGPAPAPGALGPEDAVELVQRETGERIILVHEDNLARRVALPLVEAA